MPSNRDPEAPTVLTKELAAALMSVGHVPSQVMANAEHALRAIARGDTLVVPNRPVAWAMPVDEGRGPDMTVNREYADMAQGDAKPLYSPEPLTPAHGFDYAATREPEQEKGNE